MLPSCRSFCFWSPSTFGLPVLVLHAMPNRVPPDSEIRLSQAQALSSRRNSCSIERLEKQVLLGLPLPLLENPPRPMVPCNDR
ncbi:hypothetical protein LZ30DRAFT_721544 [Colletotrichum cereale]|nr:hypothetical protein LZ30DRAFT_721544 [Colletotrichum cereale]